MIECNICTHMQVLNVPKECDCNVNDDDDDAVLMVNLMCLLY